MQPRPKIGFFIPGTGTGGPWRYVHSLLAHIDLNEFEVVIFSDIQDVYQPRPEIGIVPLSSAQKVVGQPGAVSKISPTATPPRRMRQKLMPSIVRVWAGFARESRRLAKLFRAHPVDLLHTQNTGCEESAVAARLARIPHILGTFHVDSTYDLHRERSGFTHRALECLSNHSLHRAIGVSAETSRDWIRRTFVHPRWVETIHNGIDGGQFTRKMTVSAARAALKLPDDGRIILGGVGRLDEAKGFCYLIEALVLLKLSHPNLLVAIAGQGPLRESLETQAKELGVEDNVRFLGFCGDVQIVYDAIDAFIMPSLCEALPYALLEAMASERACVGATVGGIPEVIVPNDTGLLVPPRDPSSLAAAIVKLLESAELRAQMGKRGRDRVLAHFREDTMCAETIAVYRRMLK